MKQEQADRSSRTGGQILIDQLCIQGVKHVFCVPGESYLAALDAMFDTALEVTVCRHEGGASMMAEASAKLTGQPGICFVTRGPGATNASPGVHIASQDSTPLILFVGQVGRDMRGREAFQELDYRAVFGSMAKWVTEIDDPGRIPEIISRAFHIALNGRPGPVVIALPEDMLQERAICADARPVQVAETFPAPQDLQSLSALLANAERPVVIAGGSRWDENAKRRLQEFVEAHHLPICVSFRRQSLFPGDHANYIGDLGVAANPSIVSAIKDSDLIILLGTRLSEIASQGYTLLDIPTPHQKFVHVHPGIEELNKVYQADLEFNVAPGAFLGAALDLMPAAGLSRADYIGTLHHAYLGWSKEVTEVPGSFNLGRIMVALRDALPTGGVLTTGAGNYSIWVNRFFQFGRGVDLLAPISGSMGYCVPAALAASRLDPTRRVIAFAGDGCFMMNGNEFATAVQYDLPVIVVIADNGMYGTIRMHQEQHYPHRVIATDLRNPDFAAYAKAFGGHGERVERTEDFMPAFERAVASGKPAILHCIVDPEALTPTRALSAIRQSADV
jgi:acetolactate synthase I/II/III large subunit